MNLQNQPPLFVPVEYRREIEKLSKAALMDVAWDFATRIAGNRDGEAIMRQLREAAAIITRERSQARKEGAQ